MTPTLINQLFRRNLVAAVLCLVFLLYLALSLPSAKTLWTNRDWATEQMQKAQTVGEKAQVFQVAIARIGTYERMIDWLFGIVFIVGFTGFCFLCLNAFAIGRLHREVSERDAA